MNFKEAFQNAPRESVKYAHYLDLYDHYLEKYRAKPIKILEIGVRKGGSLQMFKEYFPNGQIYGLDIDPSVVFEEDRIKIFIGDQADIDFLLKISDENGPFDIIIDDGGHYALQQICTFMSLFPELNDGGTYIIEDVHTSYWNMYGGQLGNPITAIGLGKDLIDCVNWWAFNWDYKNEQMNNGQSKENKLAQYNGMIPAIHFHDSMIVIEKQSGLQKESPLSNKKD